VSTFKITRTVEETRQAIAIAKQEGKRVALVPTMGGLHDGHLALVKQAESVADFVVVSIFVNPTQFNKPEDLKAYPGNEKDDLAGLKKTKTNLVFAPSVDEMYPQGFNTVVKINTATDILCDAHRPGHFAGVATIVTKLFLQTGADIACFGEKDFQQLFIIKRLVEDLNIPIHIEAVPTVRESDGLALSSRNARLTKEEREVAPLLQQIMKEARQKILNGDNIGKTLEAGKNKLQASGHFNVEYFEVRSAQTLELIKETPKNARLFAAAEIGNVRLIDNIAL